MVASLYDFIKQEHSTQLHQMMIAKMQRNQYLRYAGRGLFYSSKCSTSMMSSIVAAIAELAHPFDQRPLRLTIVDFLSIPLSTIRHLGCEQKFISVIHEEVYPIDPQKCKIPDISDVLVLVGFDMIWHVRPGKLGNHLHTIIETENLKRIPVIGVRALTHFSEFDEMTVRSSSLSLVMEIMQQK